MRRAVTCSAAWPAVAVDLEEMRERYKRISVAIARDLLAQCNEFAQLSLDHRCAAQSSAQWRVIRELDEAAALSCLLRR